MSYMPQVNDTKLLSDILYEVLAANDLEQAVPEITNEVPILIESINKGPIYNLLPESTIEVLDQAFKWYFTGKDINNWRFDKVYTRTEHPNKPCLTGFQDKPKSDRIEFTKVINKNELNTYLYKFKKLGVNLKEDNQTIISQSLFGLKVTYDALDRELIELRLSTLVKSKPTKGLNRFFI